jgi:hypothetical protein
MRFHVEIRRSFHVARAFNLTEEELRERILTPWWEEVPIELGDRDWDPAESSLTVLRGPALPVSQLQIGQGWSNAERSAQDVTAQVMAQPPQPAGVARGAGVALLAQTTDAASAAAAVLAALDLLALDWSAARAGILAGGGAEPPTTLIAFDTRLDAPDSAPHWWLDAGLALGALGERALLAAIGSEPLPDPLGALEPIRLDGPTDAAAQALRERLR